MVHGPWTQPPSNTHKCISSVDIEKHIHTRSPLRMPSESAFPKPVFFCVYPAQPTRFCKLLFTATFCTDTRAVIAFHTPRVHLSFIASCLVQKKTLEKRIEKKRKERHPFIQGNKNNTAHWNETAVLLKAARLVEAQEPFSTKDSGATTAH